MPRRPFSLIGPEPDWRLWERVRRRDVPPVARNWLLDQGSLTRRVMGCCAGRFRVRLLYQGWGRPLPGERRRLGMRDGGIAFIREVELLCAGEPWVFARTLVPATSLRGAARRLSRLGDRPLGAVLFADPGVTRGPVEVARLRPDSALYRSAVRSLGRETRDLWGRRALFRMGGRPLLVNEIFLPNLPGLGP